MGEARARAHLSPDEHSVRVVDDASTSSLRSKLVARILPGEATQKAEVSVLETERNPVIQRMPPPYPNLLPVQIRAFPDNLFIFIILDLKKTHTT